MLLQFGILLDIVEVDGIDTAGYVTGRRKGVCLSAMLRAQLVGFNVPQHCCSDDDMVTTESVTLPIDDIAV